MFKKFKFFPLTSITAHFQKGTFLRNLSVVMTGTAIAQLISFAMMPIVSRLFTPADFGIYGSYNSVLMVISAGATLQYAQAIVLPKHKEEGINLFFVSCLSVVMVTSIFAIAIVLFPTSVQNLMNAPNRWFLLLILLAILVAGLNQSFQAWCIRVKAFKLTSISQVIRSVSAIGIWIVSGFSHIGSMGLVLGVICADILASLNLWRVVKQALKGTRALVTFGRIKQLAHDFLDFPLYAAPQNMMNALSNGLPVLLLGYFYGIGVAGAYAFGLKILQAPMVFILTPLRQVLLQKASETHNKGVNLYSLFLKTTGGLMALAFIPCAILFIWAPELFSWVFGDEWHAAGIYARWLLLWLFVGFSNVPSVLFARILRQQRNLFFFELIILLSRTAVLVIGGLCWTSLTTVISLSVLGFILNTALIAWIGTLLHLRNTRACKEAL